MSIQVHMIVKRLWFELFMEYFIGPEHEVSDDLLFFVRQFVPSFKSSSGSINDLDPVFVKRRVAGSVPSLSDVVDWKQSFFLNFIAQIPCTLSVAVCSRGPKTDSNMRRGSSKMLAIQRVTKKVYAAPYKSRMDVKDAFMNECSYPLVYYTVNDYESNDLHLSISDNEYLCVELSITLPKEPSSEKYRNATEAVSLISVEQDNSPFPLPEDYQKVVLFQGAVPYSALVDIYQQKGQAAQNQLKSGWGRLLQSEEEQMLSRKEYIMMRGPNGKGQCQVAITEPESQLTVVDPGSKSVFRSFTSSLARSLFSEQDQEITRPNKLVCSMTYVNMPWQMITSDLMEHYSSN
ncbi:hypothetical protein EDD86DRAFT_249719 [Gorgonomyces haynaldii]|nr:hypothetical protein EDD86DRAFT_249719 [Gorgonomyces haynaldii]